MADVETAFLTFIDKVPFYGAVTACIDNPLLAKILPRAQRRVYTYGVQPRQTIALRCWTCWTEAQVSEIGQPAPSAASGDFRFTREGPTRSVRAKVPGRHNILNATAAVAIACQLEVSRPIKKSRRPGKLQRSRPPLPASRQSQRHCSSG